jgi:transcriptional regulator with XRE-family HTH domain
MHAKTVTQWMTERNVDVAQLVKASGLDERIVEAIVQGRYTPSPQQRAALADAIGVAIDSITWGHATAVDHVYGHGPQFGRSP